MIQSNTFSIFFGCEKKAVLYPSPVLMMESLLPMDDTAKYLRLENLFTLLKKSLCEFFLFI